MTKDKKKISRDEMTFLEHLEEMRWHLIRAFSAIVVFAVIAFIYKDLLFDAILLAPKNPGFITNQLLCRLAAKFHTPSLCINQTPLQLINITMSGQFTTHIIISLVAGLILAFPFVLYQAWSFIRPALYDKERNAASGAVLISSFLFLSGVLFGYFIIIPMSVNFLSNYKVSTEVSNQIALNSYISNVASTVLASGVVFELPVILFFLTKIGLVTPSFLRKYRRHAIIIILVLAAIITPPDIFSQILVSIPLLFLYEVSIFVSAVVHRKHNV